MIKFNTQVDENGPNFGNTKKIGEMYQLGLVMAGRDLMHVQHGSETCCTFLLNSADHRERDICINHHPLVKKITDNEIKSRCRSLQLLLSPSLLQFQEPSHHLHLLSLPATRSSSTMAEKISSRGITAAPEPWS